MLFKGGLTFLYAIALSVPILGQAVSNEKAVVEKVVNIYLSKTDPVAVKNSLAPGAKIISVDSSGNRIIQSPISKPARRTISSTVFVPRQTIVNIDIALNGATVKVESDFSDSSSSTSSLAKHIQFISLLKIDDDWKIVSILMPSVGFTQSASK